MSTCMGILHFNRLTLSRPGTCRCYSNFSYLKKIGRLFILNTPFHHNLYEMCTVLRYNIFKIYISCISCLYFITSIFKQQITSYNYKWNAITLIFVSTDLKL